jgi:hypothetical protein
MNPLSRRSFLSQATVVGTAAMGLVGLPARAQDEKENRLNNVLARNHVVKVVAVSGQTLYTTTAKGEPKTFQVTSSTQIWRGKYGNDLSVLRPGDDLLTKNDVNPANGQFIATKIWADVFRIEGVITSVGAAALRCPRLGVRRKWQGSIQPRGRWCALPPK